MLTGLERKYKYLFGVLLESAEGETKVAGSGIEPGTSGYRLRYAVQHVT